MRTQRDCLFSPYCQGSSRCHLRGLPGAREGIQHVPWLISDPTDCRIHGLSGEGGGGSQRPGFPQVGWEGLCVLRPPPVAPQLVPTQVMPPT